jgi:hypothetical protein
MRMRLSAAYKGVNALLMKEGAQDFRSGQKLHRQYGNLGKPISATREIHQPKQQRDSACLRRRVRSTLHLLSSAEASESSWAGGVFASPLDLRAPWNS